MSLREIIPAEINEDALAHEITKLVKIFKPKTILEIGSSSGEGSTQAFIKGITDSDLFCIEASQPRYEKLVENVKEYPFVHPYHTTSVRDDESMTEGEVRQFFGLLNGVLDLPVMEIGEERVLKWYENEHIIVDEMKTPRDGIRTIMRENSIERFDMVLIDGSPFTAISEMKLIYGAKVIVMDDIMGLKCLETHARMKQSRDYMLYKTNTTLRNGFSIWIRK